MDVPQLSRYDLERLWRERVNGALVNYQRAKNLCSERVVELQTGMTPSPDGNLAVTWASHAESAALKEYLRVLRIFADLVVNGHIPNEQAER